VVQQIKKKSKANIEKHSWLWHRWCLGL